MYTSIGTMSPELLVAIEAEERRLERLRRERLLAGQWFEHTIGGEPEWRTAATLICDGLMSWQFHSRTCTVFLARGKADGVKRFATIGECRRHYIH